MKILICFVIMAIALVAAKVVEIKKCEQLFKNKDILNDPNVEVVLKKDLDCQGKTYRPVGDKKKPFGGTFTPNGFKIRNFKLDPETPYGSIFHHVKETTEEAPAVIDRNAASRDPTEPGIITFDDVPGDQVPLPNPYQGFTFKNFYVAVGSNLGGGYKNGVVSGTKVAYNGYGGRSYITNNGKQITFFSGYFTAAWKDGLVLTISTTTTLGESTQQLNLTTSSPQFLSTILGPGDKITFETSSGSGSGVGYGYGGNGNQFVLDNLLLDPNPRPLGSECGPNGQLYWGVGCRCADFYNNINLTPYYCETGSSFCDPSYATAPAPTNKYNLETVGSFSFDGNGNLVVAISYPAAPGGTTDQTVIGEDEATTVGSLSGYYSQQSGIFGSWFLASVSTDKCSNVARWTVPWPSVARYFKTNQTYNATTGTDEYKFYVKTVQTYNKTGSVFQLTRQETSQTVTLETVTSFAFSLNTSVVANSNNNEVQNVTLRTNVDISYSVVSAKLQNVTLDGSNQFVVTYTGGITPPFCVFPSDVTAKISRTSLTVDSSNLATTATLSVANIPLQFFDGRRHAINVTYIANAGCPEGSDCVVPSVDDKTYCAMAYNLLNQQSVVITDIFNFIQSPLEQHDSFTEASFTLSQSGSVIETGQSSLSGIPINGVIVINQTSTVDGSNEYSANIVTLTLNQVGGGPPPLDITSASHVSVGVYSAASGTPQFTFTFSYTPDIESLFNNYNLVASSGLYFQADINVVYEPPGYKKRTVYKTQVKLAFPGAKGKKFQSLRVSSPDFTLRRRHSGKREEELEEAPQQVQQVKEAPLLPQGRAVEAVKQEVKAFIQKKSPQVKLIETIKQMQEKSLKSQKRTPVQNRAAEDVKKNNVVQTSDFVEAKIKEFVRFGLKAENLEKKVISQNSEINTLLIVVAVVSTALVILIIAVLVVLNRRRRQITLQQSF